MTKYQVSFDRRERLSIEIEAYSDDDAYKQAEALLYNPRAWDVQELDTEFHDIFKVERDPDDDREAERDDKADRDDWKFHQAYDQ